MIDFDAWDEMLRRYVDGQGRIDYQTWRVESAEELNDWLQGMSQANKETFHDANEQLAFWLNLYNALIIAQVLSLYPIASVRPNVFGFPNWLSFFRFFQRSIFRLGECCYSLNDIEHGVLRRKWRDPRIHFALVCAAVGCPLLRPQAYSRHLIQQQLEEDAKRFINNPSKVYYEAHSHTLCCSRIFQWYRQDFLQVAPSMPAYLQTYLDLAVPLIPPPRLRYLPYDWRLNQQTG